MHVTPKTSGPEQKLNVFVKYLHMKYVFEMLLFFIGKKTHDKSKQLHHREASVVQCMLTENG